MQYTIAKGVFDILPKTPDDNYQWRDVHYWQHVESVAREIAMEYGYREIRTPLFESTDLFKRSIGTTSDIVTKEMYTFLDKAGRSLTLRPEGTAPVMRSLIEKNLHQQNEVTKFFYIAPMFRYERQQAGRYRQHHQFGVEAIGINSPYQDVEVIDLLYSFLSMLNLKETRVEVNSIGSKETREDFRGALKKYLRPFIHELSEDSQTRYETNPFRILDSKDSRDQEILQDAPSILDYLNGSLRNHFETVCKLLEQLKIPFRINPNLVRGLDYYNQTVFEVTSQELGAQNSLGGGGRYDGLIPELGGPDLPACGFGAGIERIIQLMLSQGAPLPARPRAQLFLIPLGDEACAACLKMANELRKEHVTVDMEMSGKKLKQAMKVANATQAHYVVVVGEQELTTGRLVLKKMDSGETEEIAFDRLIQRLKNDKPVS